MGGRFAGEVPSLEFGEGGVDVVGVEYTASRTIWSSASTSETVKTSTAMGWSAPSVSRIS